jgi:intracellular sulfur oxidation DsrE/DsrF family protein
MKENSLNQTSQRREFLGTLATGAAAIGLASLPSLGLANASTPAIESPSPGGEDWTKAEEVFKKINGKNRAVFDVTKAHGVYPFAWPRIFLVTNEKTGSPEKDSSVVVILRAYAIAYALEDRLWSKYNFGDTLHMEDPFNKDVKPQKNPFSNMAPFPFPGLGPVKIGIQDLQASGVQFVVCDMALSVYSAAIAGGMNLDPAEVRKDWVSGLLKGITVVPSGVWAIGRAQQKQCAYIFAS